jgi:hypothetical protein
MAKPAKEGHMLYRLEIRSELKMRALKYALDRLVDEIIVVERVVEPPKSTRSWSFDKPQPGSVQSFAQKAMS